MSELSNARQRTFKIVILAFVVLLSLGVLEVTLRLFPSVIGLSLLSRFEPGLRAEIAARVGVQTRSQLLEIPSSDRTDGGPPILRPLPLSEKRQFNEKADLAAGAKKSAIVDELGFCNPPGLADAAPFDVVMVGDSFTYCTAVAAEDTATYVLGTLTGLSTYNLGVSGIGPDAYLELLRAFNETLRPRVVVMNFYEGNDLRDTLQHDDFISRGGDDSETEKPNWLAANSYALQFLRANVILAVDRISEILHPEQNINFRYATTLNGKKFSLNIANKDTDEVEHAMRIRSGELSFELFRRSLDAYVTWARSNNIIPILTYIPSMYTAYDDRVSFEDPDVGRVVSMFSRDQRAWFTEFAKSAGLRFVDMTPHFQEATANGILTHYPGNVHLTPAGHRIVATQLHDSLVEAIALARPR